MSENACNNIFFSFFLTNDQTRTYRVAQAEQFDTWYRGPNRRVAANNLTGA